MKSSQTILITGGAGFIGANLVRALVNHGTIHLLVEKNSNLWRLSDIITSLIIHEMDLADFDSVRTLIHAIKPSHIFHLAAYGGMCTQLNQKQIYDVNFYGTINLVNACKEVGFDCFINTGSSSEYGMQDKPMHEDLALEPISDYGVAKAAATQFCLKEALFNKLPIYTIRPFSVYGDYEMPSRLIPTIMVSALTAKPIQLSSPHFVRDYIYIKDMIDLYLAVAILRDATYGLLLRTSAHGACPSKPPACHSKSPGRRMGRRMKGCEASSRTIAGRQDERLASRTSHIFNGGTGVQSSIQDVITTVQTLIGKPLDIVWGAHVPRPWEPRAWRGDIVRAQDILGWQPKYNLHDGLQASLEWFKNNLEMYQDTPDGQVPDVTHRNVNDATKKPNKSNSPSIT